MAERIMSCCSPFRRGWRRKFPHASAILKLRALARSRAAARSFCSAHPGARGRSSFVGGIISGAEPEGLLWDRHLCLSRLLIHSQLAILRDASTVGTDKNVCPTYRRALDQGQSLGSLTNPAITGFLSMYETTRANSTSSRTQ